MYVNVNEDVNEGICFHGVTSLLSLINSFVTLDFKKNFFFLALPPSQRQSLTLLFVNTVGTVI